MATLTKILKESLGLFLKEFEKFSKILCSGIES